VIFRIIGGALVCVACAALGLYMSNKGMIRARQLTEFKQSLLMLKSEIEFAAYPLPLAFAHIAGRFAGFADFYETLSERLADKHMGIATAWGKGLTEFDNSYLKPEDLQAIGGLGAALGSIDSAVQLKAIDNMIADIDEILARLAEQNLKDSKMYKQLGLLGGVLIVVVLL